MKAPAASRLPTRLRQELVLEVRAVLPDGADFNALYGQLLARLERADNPTLEQARLLLQQPGELLAERVRAREARASAAQRLRNFIVAANVSKLLPEREGVIADTLAFLGRFERLDPVEVKRLTLLRQENGHRDPLLVPFARVRTADDLVANLEKFCHVDDQFVLKHTDQLQGCDLPVPEFA